MRFQIGDVAIVAREPDGGWPISDLSSVLGWRCEIIKRDDERQLYHVRSEIGIEFWASDSMLDLEEGRTMKHYAMVGMQHRPSSGSAREPKGWAVRLVDSLPKDEDLELVRDPDNKFDRFAIQVWVRGVHVAFIAATQNRDLATFMDARHRRFPLGAELGARLQAKFYRSSSGAPLVAVLEMQ